MTLPPLAGYDAEIIRPRLPKTGETVPAPGASYVETESFEILPSSEGQLVLRVPPFARLRRDDRGKQLSVAYDYRLRISWTWTGTQRLFAPEVQRFDIYQKPAHQKEWEPSIITLPAIAIPDR
jgi:hypothetical protein